MRPHPLWVGMKSIWETTFESWTFFYFFTHSLMERFNSIREESKMTISEIRHELNSVVQQIRFIEANDLYDTMEEKLQWLELRKASLEADLMRALALS